MYRLQYVTITHPGKKRMKNEDNFYIDGKWKQNIEQHSMKVSGSVETGKLLAAVFDGMGGTAKGERASFIAAENMEFYDAMIKNGQASPLKNDEMQYVDMANKAICREMSKSGRGMGTTLAILEFSNDSVIAENIGDSRIYRWSHQKLERISTDHTMVARLIRMKQITEEEARTHHMNHRLTQYLGIPEEEMYLEPAVTEIIPLNAGDKYLICSDGLTDMLTDSEIAEVMKSNSSANSIAEQLVQDALAAGGKDNVTVCVIDVAANKVQGHGVKKSKKAGCKVVVIVFAIIMAVVLALAGMKYINEKKNQDKTENVEEMKEEQSEDSVDLEDSEDIGGSKEQNDKE